MADRPRPEIRRNCPENTYLPVGTALAPGYCTQCNSPQGNLATSPFKVVTVSGDIYRPSHTLVLTQTPTVELGQSLPTDSRVIELADIAVPLGATPARDQAPAELQTVLNEIESAGLLLVISLVCRGSYPGLLKHLFDLIDLNALTSTPVLFVAAGGTERHALTLGRQLHPLFGFFQAITLPTGVYVSEIDFDDYRIVSEPLKARIRLAAGRTAPLFGGCSELLEITWGTPMDVSWLLPTHGDDHFLGTSQGARPISLPYLMQTVQATDSFGYHGALISTGRSCEDPWAMASALAPSTEHLRFLVVVRPGIVSPTVSTRIAVALDRLFGGRLSVDVIAGDGPDENRGGGIHLGHVECYEVTDKFPRVWRRILQGEAVDFHGKHIRMENAKAFYPPLQRPYSPLYFGGSSEAVYELAGEQVDVYLTWNEPLPVVTMKIADARQRTARHGRMMEFGIRLYAIVRETTEEARRAVDRLTEHISDETIVTAQQSFTCFNSEDQRRMVVLHDGYRDRLEIRSNPWAGVGLVRGGAGTTLVGNPRQVAECIGECAKLDISNFIFSDYPHLEEAYCSIELVFPLLPEPYVSLASRGLTSPTGPFGEMVADDVLPARAGA